MSDGLTWYDYEAARLRLERATRMATPSMMLLPKLSLDGDQWCALFGENLQDGVAGFGDSPDEAYYDFDQEWFKKLPRALHKPEEKK